MSRTPDEQIKQLKRTIAEMEAQRRFLGDAAVDAALIPFKQKLAQLEAQATPTGKEPADLPMRKRKLVTLLYVDVVGSTAMTQHLDHEDTLEIMDGALRRLAVPVDTHGGHVTRFMGDGFKAVFGDPIAREDDPEQAIRAGLEILDVSQSLAQELQEGLEIEGFQVRIGINTGLAALGGYTEAEDTVMGRAVNLAARIESAAPPGGLLISHNTYRHVRGVFNFEPRESISAKGFPEPIPVYLVREIKPRAFRVRTLGVEGVETRMVGRETELKRLQDALLTAIEEGEGRVLTITGEAGVGKSRLLYEFQNWIELLPPPEVWFFQGRGKQDSQGLPFSLLRDVFAFRFQILDDDSGEQARRKIENGFCDVFGEDEEGLMKTHILGQLLGFDFSASPHLEGVLTDPEQLRNRGLMYLFQYFQVLSQESPIVIFLEDIHWGDISSLDAVDYLGERITQQHLLIICAARPTLFERRPDWCRDKIYHTLLELHPLSKQDSVHLLDEILQLVEDIPADVREMVIVKAEGNPFYMEEMIKMLIEEGVIIPGDEIWRVEVDRLGQIDVPSTLVGVLQARLDSLPQQERTVLKQASVIGRLFWDRLVAHIQAKGGSGGDPHLVPQALTSLRDRELVYRREESAFVGAVEYLFKHDVLREVTYESVLKRLRKAYHGLVADWLIANCGDRIGEYSGLVAEHLVLAGRGDQACKYYLQAGEFALLSYANQEAETHFRRALSLECKKLDKSRLLAGLGEALSRQNRYEEAIKIRNEAIEIYLGLENLTSAARLYAKSSRDAWMLGDAPRGLEICLAGLKWIKDEPESHEVALLMHETGRAYYFNGIIEEGSEYCQKALQMAEQLEDIEIQADTLITMGLLANQPPEAAIDSLTSAAELAEKGNLLKIASRAHGNLGILRAELNGDILGAKEDYQHSVAIARRRGDLHQVFLISWFLFGNLDLQLSDLSEIEEHFQSLEDLAAEISDPDLTKPRLLICKADLLGLQGELQPALVLLRECKAKAQECGDFPHLEAIDDQIAYTNLEIHWSGGEPNWQEVAQVLNESIDFKEMTISSQVSPLCMLSTASTYQGDHRKAHQYLEAAKQETDDFSTFWDYLDIAKATAFLAASEGRWAESFEVFRDLTETYAQKGYRWEHAHTLCDWGDALVSRGESPNLEAARKLYNQALEIYDDLKATWYRKQIEKRIDLVNKDLLTQ